MKLITCFRISKFLLVARVPISKKIVKIFHGGGGFVVSASFMLEVKMPWVGSRKASGWTVKLQLADVPDAQAENLRGRLVWCVFVEGRGV